ncbi:MAG TPA: efflux RND transporter periplasmic adaptor subunit [Anaerolineales bacterium]|nr:efflux RND transporter periplasmic adaptor subunit [Anaerolineales bacterium]
MGNFIKKNRVVLILVIVAVVAFLAFRFNQSRSTDTASQFQTAVVERGSLTATIGATGTVRAQQTAVLVWQAAGTVDVVNVKVGDNVPAEYVMAYLSKTSLPQSIILAEADLASAQKALDDLLNSDTARAQAVIALRDAQEAYDKAYNWRRELDNDRITVKEIVYKKRFGITIPEVKEYKTWADEATKTKAQEDLELKKGLLDDAQRKLDRLTDGNSEDIIAAQARVDAAQATINLARVTAPFGGIVTESYPLPGDQVSAGATAFRLDDLSKLLVDVDVSEVDINSVSVGQPVSLTFDAILGNEYHGEVVEVAQTGTSVSGVVSFKVTVELLDADASVKPGMTAAVNITVKEMNDVVLIPNRSVRLSDGNRVVYLLVDGQPVKTNVRLGSSSDAMSVIVGGDVNEGDTIILNPPAEFGGPGGGPGGGFGG